MTRTGSHPHGHDWTSYDILHCCICAPESKSAKHDPVERDEKLFCRKCGQELFTARRDAAPLR